MDSNDNNKKNWHISKEKSGQGTVNKDDIKTVKVQYRSAPANSDVLQADSM
jgi:hypothetical protein